jgi:hypothetical protein
VIRSYTVARREVDVGASNRRRRAAASTAATRCAGIGVPEDLARFELLAALEQDSTNLPPSSAYFSHEVLKSMAEVGSPRHWGSYGDYGCRLNALTVEELFDRYARSRFLYPEKRARLAPYLAEIVDNWRRALGAGELIIWFATHEAEVSGGWATVSGWRSSRTGWHNQHLVSNGSPTGTRAVMLAGQSARLSDGNAASLQNWFRRTNRFAARAFGAFVDRVRQDQTALIDYELLAVGCNLTFPAPDGVAVCAVETGDKGQAAELHALVAEVRGPVFVTAEDLDGDDLLLDQVDQIYRLVGLRRYRSIWLAYDHGELAGAALCYRAPLGFNFSFLENRCDLVVRAELNAARRSAVAAALLRAGQPIYADISTHYIPLVTDSYTASTVVAMGAEAVRSYSQSIWLRAAFSAWYDHIDEIYARRLSRHPGVG